MKSAKVALAFILCLAWVAQAQEKKSTISAFGGEQDERSSVRIGFWDSEKKTVVGEFSIDYGRPVWKKEYENSPAFDAMTKGKTWRLGSNFWTVLDTNIPIKISGKEIPVGHWYLGLHRSDDGASWSLAFIDPAKVRATRLDAFWIAQAPIEFRVPMNLEKVTDSKEKLTVTLVPQKDNFRLATLKIAWGLLQLSAPVEASIGS